jgi:DNA modification methylase
MKLTFNADNVRNINELREWNLNPRGIKKDKFEELKNRIKRFGQFKPLIICPDGEVIGGNMRLKAYRELGITDVWVSVVNPKTEAEKVEIALADNEEMGYYEEEALAELINQYRDTIKLSDYSIHLGQPTSLEDLLSKYGPEPIEDEVPEVAENPVSKLGEVYQLGRHRLMCGDSTKIEDVEKLMNGKKADMVFTDPPYGVSYASKNEYLNTIAPGNRIQTPIENDHMSLQDTENFIYACFVNLRMMLADKSSYYITAPQGSDLLMMMMMMQKAGLTLRHMLIWVKNNHVLGRTDYNYKHEPILFGWINTHNFYGNGRHQFSTWEIDKPLKSDLHPTMKPIALIENALLNSTKKDDIVADLFGGSGSTLIACEQTNRTCYMMEIDPKYCDVIRKRYAKFIGKEEEWEQTTPLVK